MALARRTGQRYTASIWTGFVDAMTALLLVLIFVLSVFMIVQFLLNARIGELGSELFTLSGQLEEREAALARGDARVQTLETQLSDLQRLLGAEREMTARLDSALSLSRDEASGLATTVQDLEAAIGRLELRAVELATQLASALSDVELRDSDLARITAEFAAVERNLEAQLALRNQLLADLQTQLEELNAELATEQTRRRDVTTSLAESEANERAAQERLAEQSIRLADLTATLKSTTGILDDERRDAARAQAQLAQTLTELAQIAERLDTAQTALAASDSDSERLRGQLIAALARASEAERLAASDKSRFAEREQTLETTIDDLRARLGAQEIEIGDASQEILEVRRTNTELAARITQLQDLVDDTRRDSEQQTAFMQRELDAADEQLATLMLDLEESQQDAERTLQLLAVARQAEDELKARIEGLEQRLVERDAAAVQEAEGLEARLRTALANLVRAEQDGREQASENETLDTALTEARRLAAEQEAMNEESLRRVALLNRQIAQLQVEISILQTTIEESERRDRDEEAQVSLLGKELNQALARAAAMAKQNEALERRERERLEEEAGRLKRYQSEFLGSLRDLMEGQEGVQIVGDRFLFSSEVLFAFSDATLTPIGKAQIRRVAQLMLDLADNIPPQVDWVLRVDGHTDDVPVVGRDRFVDNWELSAERSLSVVRYLIDDLDFPPQRLVSAGFGEYRPVAGTGDTAGRARNRRIEFKLTEP